MKSDINQHIWHTLKATRKPIMVLAPMDDVTDLVFRQLIEELASADLYMTEFASVEGFCSAGRPAIERRLRLADGERNVIAQIWGKTPAKYRETAEELSKRPFVGIDINMGCPARDVIKTGACSGLIRTPDLAAEIIAATKAGAGDLPVSVKTRIGFNEPDIEGWIGHLLRQDIAALTVHLRTVKEQSKVPAHWELMPQILALRDQIAPDTVIIGNGDIESREEALEKHAVSGLDGVMVGRGIFHNPWLFETEARDHSVEERRATLLRHLDLFEQTWTNHEKRFEPLKKFFKIYIQGFENAAELRAQLMDTASLDEVRSILHN